MNNKDIFFWPIFIALLLGCFGMGIALHFVRNPGNVSLRLPPPDFRAVPPELIKFQQTSLAICSFEGTAICFTKQNETTFIAAAVNPNALYFFNEQGKLLRKINLEEEPKALVLGQADTIFPGKIIIAHPKSVAVYDAEGKKERILGEWTGEDLSSLALTSKYLFAVDNGKRCIYRISESGLLDKTFGTLQNLTVYAAPITMTYSAKNDLLYVSNPGKHRVEVFSQEGVHSSGLSWGEPSGDVYGFAGCCNPIALEALDSGCILTVEKSVSRIKIFGPGGKLDCAVAGANVLEDIPDELTRQASPSGGRYFSAVKLPGGRIAVFDFDYGIMRFFSPRMPSD